MTAPVYVPLSAICCFEQLSPRVELAGRLDVDRVREFAMLLEADADALPPVVVVEGEPGTFARSHPERLLLLADGAHRLAARAQLGGEFAARVPVDIRRATGGLSPDVLAFQLAVEAAAKTAMPLSRGERRAAIRRLVAEQPEASDRAIARIVGCSHHTVGSVRGQSAQYDREADAGSDSTGWQDLAAALDRALLPLKRLTENRGIAELFGLPDQSASRIAPVLAKRFDEDAAEVARSLGVSLIAAAKLLDAEVKRL